MTDLLTRGSFAPLEWGHVKQNVPETSTLIENFAGCVPGGIEEEWQVKVCNLQILICELLLKNEQLRMALGARTAPNQDRVRQGVG